MLDANLKAQLKAYLERLQKPLEMVATLDDSKAAGEVKSLLADLVALSDKITVVENNDLAVRKPSFAINPGVETGVRFAGVPLGHEFTSWCWPCCTWAAIPPRSADLIEQIKAINGRCTSRPTTRCPATTARTWCRR
jgi:alkyl hydroperoxide reductase subunit F